MAHYDKIPALLDNLITGSVAEAARRVGITPQTVWNYLVRSKMGDPKLQDIEFCGVVAPFHVQLANCRALMAAQIEQNALERARDGCYVDVFFQGVRQYERVKKQQYADWSDADIEALGCENDAYELRPTKQWLKPSDALVIKMLESWQKKYRPHAQVDVQYGGVLRLERPDERTARTVDAKPIFEDTEEVERRGGHLALARPAKNSAELDQWNAAGEFKPQPVTFVDAQGQRTDLVAAPDPLLSRMADQASKERTAAAPPALPVAPRSPAPTTMPPPAPPARSVGDGRERLGRGLPPKGGFKVA